MAETKREKSWKNDPILCAKYIKAQHIIYLAPRAPTKDEKIIYEQINTYCKRNTSWLTKLVSTLLSQEEYEKYLEERDACTYFQKVYEQLQKKYRS